MACLVESCPQPVKARGWCNAHYLRWGRHGDPLAGGHTPQPQRPLSERFWEKVTPSDPADCWEWEGSRMASGGYGALGRLRAHRVSWELANDTRVPDGMHVLHPCDNPPCVNPAHLSVGTNADNMRDVAERKRQAGERNGFHKLTQSEVDEIRAAHSSGETNASQARRYRVHPSTISLIVNRVNWVA